MSDLEPEKESDSNKNLIKIFRRVGRALANLEYEYHLEHASPEFCIQILAYPNLKMFSKLHRKLRVSTKEWITDFIQFKGLFTLLHCVEYLCHRKKHSALFNSLELSKCVCCIREVLNVKYGMESIINLATEETSFVPIFAKAALNENQVVKKEIFEIFSAIAMFSQKGYSVCLSIFEHIKKEKCYQHRFNILIDEINSAKNTHSYLVVVVSFLNCLIDQPSELRDRIKIRIEFISKNIFKFNSYKINKIRNINLSLFKYDGLWGAHISKGLRYFWKKLFINFL